MELVPSIGLGFCPPQTGGTAEQWMRVVSEGAAHVLCMADAHEHGWSPYWKPGAELLLNFAEAGVRTATDEDRLRAAMLHVKREFVPAINQLLFTSAEQKAKYADMIGLPGGGLFLAEIISGNVRVEWIGAATATLIRNGRVIAQTKPHTLYEQAVQLGATPDVLANIPPVIARTICEDHACETETWTPPMPLERNDYFVVVETGAARSVDDDTLCRIVERNEAPTTTATAIAHSIERTERHRFAAVAVVRWTAA